MPFKVGNTCIPTTARPLAHAAACPAAAQSGALVGTCMRATAQKQCKLPQPAALSPETALAGSLHHFLCEVVCSHAKCDRFLHAGDHARCPSAAAFSHWLLAYGQEVWWEFSIHAQCKLLQELTAATCRASPAHLWVACSQAACRICCHMHIVPASAAAAFYLLQCGVFATVGRGMSGQGGIHVWLCGRLPADAISLRLPTWLLMPLPLSRCCSPLLQLRC